jgi:hypothetical protein
MLKVHDDKDIDDKEMIKRVVYNGDCQDFITNGKELIYLIEGF